MLIRISCIIPSTCSKKTLDNLKNCVSSLKKSAKNVKIKIKIFLIADSLESLNPLGKKVNYFVNVQNKSGFSVMNNIAISKALELGNTDYFLLVNDDVEVNINFFKEIKNILFRKKPDLICPLIFIKNHNVIDSFGIEYFKSGFITTSNSLIDKTNIVTATCLLVSCRLIIKMIKVFGFVFNPMFYFYHEDVEFSIRALSLNAKVVKSHKVIAYHLGQKTSKRNSFFVKYYSLRNFYWIILIDWPFELILKNIISIVIVGTWLMWSQFKLYAPIIILLIFLDTLLHAIDLMKYRLITLRNYPKGFKFESLLLPYIFRTRQEGLVI